METRNYQYGGGHGLIDNQKAIEDQFYARNQLRNALVELDRKTRSRFNELTNQDNPYFDRVQTINAEIDSLRAEIMMLRVPKAGEKSGKWRKAMGKGTPQGERICALEDERKDLKPLAKARQVENRENYGEQLALLEKERRATIKELYNRAVAGYINDRSNPVPPLFWMNASEICDEHNSERGAAMKNKTQVQFHAFRDVRKSRTMIRYHVPVLTEDQQHSYDAYQEKVEALRAKIIATKDRAERKELSDRIKNLKSERESKIDRKQGWPEEELFAGTTAIRIEPINLTRDVNNPAVWDKSLTRAERRRRMETRVHLRINSDENGEAVWGSIPVVFHRPLPPGAVVKEAAIGREKIGSKYRWNLTLTIKYEEEKQVLNDGVVAVDLGWAQETLKDADGRIRVAGVRVKGGQGETFEEFCLPSDYEKKLEFLDSLKSIVDKHTNEAFDAITEWRKNNETPQVLKDALDRAEASLQARKALGRTPPTGHLRALVWAIRKKEAVCDGLQAILEKWYERFIHLSEWIANGRDNLLAWKKDYYRRFAYKLALGSKILLLDADDFAKMAKTPAPESGKKSIKNDLRHLAAPSMLRDALEQAFDKGKVFYSSFAASSRTCSQCGHLNEELGATRTFKCAACGYEDDREANATANVMKQFEKAPGTFSTKRKAAEKLANLNEKEEGQAKAAD
ncbi:MAG: zinc ribbon domain-containing protein [Terriglobales bacterium]